MTNDELDALEARIRRLELDWAVARLQRENAVEELASLRRRRFVELSEEEYHRTAELRRSIRDFERRIRDAIIEVQAIEATLHTHTDDPGGHDDGRPTTAL